MQASDIIAYSRILLAEDEGNARWSDTNLLILASVATQLFMMDVKWPEGFFGATLNQQELPLPPFLEIRDVQVNGQTFVPTTLDRLSGTPLNYFDQTAPNYATQWQSVPPTTFPQSTWDMNYPTAAGNAPYNVGQRPVYYLRGGNIGVVPAPATGSFIAIRILPQPVNYNDPSNLCIYPDYCKRALGCLVVQQAVESDSNETDNSDAADKWAARYNIAMKKANRALRTLQVNLDRSPQFATYRTFYQSPVPNTSGGN